MRIEIASGQTKSPSGITLVPVLLGDAKGERVFLLVQTEGEDQGAESLKDECINVLTHVILEGEGEAYARLEGALKEINGLLKGLLLSGSVKDVHAIVGVLERNGVLHLSHVGRAEAYLIRDGSAAQITEYARGKQPMAFMHIVSGPLEERDHVIVSTQRLLRAITPAQLTQLVLRGGDVVRHITSELEGEKEVACVLHVAIPSERTEGMSAREHATPSRALQLRARGRSPLRGNGGVRGAVRSALAGIPDRVRGVLSKSRGPAGALVRGAADRVGRKMSAFRSDLYDPKRKRRAHLFLLAGAGMACLVMWMLIQLSLSSQKSQTRAQLATLVQQINADLDAAGNRQLTGDTDSANAMLKRAEDRTRQVMGNESGLFRSEALSLLDRIRSKREQMNNVVRIPPRMMANLSAVKPDVLAQGLIGLADGEFIAYDRQDEYRILLNSVDRPTRIAGEELILDGTAFPRYQAQAFLTTGNSLIEFVSGQLSTMKTEDSAGWPKGIDLKTYLRYLYVLSPEKKQIYKYERLSGRYGPPTEYNVNGDLEGAMDMTITGPIYVLKDASTASKTAGARDVVKLLRGEKQAFTIRNLPPGALNGVTKVFKSSGSGNFYFLDPEGKRVVVTTSDGDLGDSLYLKQYVLESDQVGKPVDLYVDAEDTRLYVLDEKRLFVIDLQGK